MNVDIYDTSVHITEGHLLHFDVLLPCGNRGRAEDNSLEWLQKHRHNYRQNHPGSMPLL